LTEAWHHILARYESCEDLAQGLAPQAHALAADLCVTPEAVALKIAAGLQHPSVGLAPEEAQWVCTRLVELLEHGL
jgi:ADP-heptose:LPS heptosyltransferase